MGIRGLRAFNSVRLWRYLEVLRHATAEADSLKALERGWEFLAARSLGVRELYEPMDLLYADPQGADGLAEALLAQGRAVWLPRVRTDSPLLRALETAWHLRGLVRVSPAPGYPVIKLGSAWIEPESRFDAGRRSGFRRSRRHAERLGCVSFEMRAPEPAELPGLLDEAWTLAADARRGAFFRSYAAAAARRGVLRLGFMRVGGCLAAMQLALEYDGRFWLLKTGYDEQFARCAPGTLLTLHSVRYAARRGLRSYEFLGATGPWTRRWTRSLRECVAVRAYPFTRIGVAALAIDAAAFGWRRLAQRGA